MTRVANVIVHQGKAYLPTLAELEGEAAGMYLDVPPVYTAAVSVEGLTDALAKVAAAGNPRVPIPTSEERQRYRGGPVPKAAKVGSWKALAKGGALYSINWQPSGVTSYTSMLDEKGRFVFDPAKTRHFPPGTDIRTIVEAVLEDVRSRPEVGSSESGHD